MATFCSHKTSYCFMARTSEFHCNGAPFDHPSGQSQASLVPLVKSRTSTYKMYAQCVCAGVCWMLAHPKPEPIAKWCAPHRVFQFETEPTDQLMSENAFLYRIMINSRANSIHNSVAFHDVNKCKNDRKNPNAQLTMWTLSKANGMSELNTMQQ